MDAIVEVSKDSFDVTPAFSLIMNPLKAATSVSTLF